jgi:hypothetical protein
LGPAPPGGGDANFDGSVDLKDLNMVRNEFGQRLEQAVPVPEPTTGRMGFVLSIFAVVMTLLHRLERTAVRDVNFRRRKSCPSKRPRSVLTPLHAVYRRLVFEQCEPRTMLSFGTPIINMLGQTPDLGGFPYNDRPPDTVGDVGKHHYVQMINAPGGSTFVAYNKHDGSIALGPIQTSSLAP